MANKPRKVGANLSDAPPLDLERAMSLADSASQGIDPTLPYAPYARAAIVLRFEVERLRTENERLRDVQCIQVTAPDGSGVAAPCAISGCQYAQVEHAEAELASLRAAEDLWEDLWNRQRAEIAKLRAAQTWQSLRELRTYLDGIVVTSDNIGDIRRALLLPWDSQWNGWVRDETATRENREAALPPAVEEP